MPRVRVAVAAGLAALLVVAGCQTGAKQQKPKPKQTAKTKEQKGPKIVNGMREFVDPEGVFSLWLPVKWYANGGSSQAVEISPLRSNTNLRAERDLSVASIEVLVVPIGTGESPSQALERIIGAMLKNKPAATRGRVKELKMANSPGAWVDARLASDKGDQVKMFVATGGKAARRMLMLAYSPVGEWNKNLPIFRKVAESFKFSRPST